MMMMYLDLRYRKALLIPNNFIRVDYGEKYFLLTTHLILLKNWQDKNKKMTES